MINDCTVCTAKAERNSLIRRKEEEDHWLFTLCCVPIGRVQMCVHVCMYVCETCMVVSVCTCQFVYLTCVCVYVCTCVARRRHWCQYELAGLAVGTPNDRLHQVRGAFNTSKHTGRTAHWCQIRRRTSHTLKWRMSNLIGCCSAFFLE